jgi:Ca2+-binding EF-hand superfamily protein
MLPPCHPETERKTIMIGSIPGGAGAIGHPSHKKMFKRMDANGDGGLDQSELAGMAKRTGKDAASLLASLDTDKDGKVSSSEMDSGASKRHQESAQAQSAGTAEFTTALMGILKQLQGADADAGAEGTARESGHHPSPEVMFKKMDANGDGNLDATELSGLAARSGQDAAKILTDLDTDGDGKVNAGELEAGAAKRRQEMAQQRAQNGSGQDPQNPITQITTTLMNILKQIQDSQSANGSDNAATASAHAATLSAEPA